MTTHLKPHHESYLVIGWLILLVAIVTVLAVSYMDGRVYDKGKPEAPAIATSVGLTAPHAMLTSAVELNRGSCLKLLDPQFRHYINYDGPWTIVVTPSGHVVSNTPGGFQGFSGCSTAS